MMTEWWRHLRGRPFYWVLDGTHPAADLFMLRFVVERPPQAAPLRAARLALSESTQVEMMKSHLEASIEGVWEPRYETTIWTLRALAELGVAGDDERVAEALDVVLDQVVAANEEEPINGLAIGLHTALAFRFHEDARVREGIERLQRTLQQGELPAQKEARVDWLAQAAMAFAEQPEEERDAELLLVLADELARVAPTSLGRYAVYGFPVYDRPDDLVVARSALRLGIEGEWLRPWVERIAAAQDDQGLWRLQQAEALAGGVKWEEMGEASRWISAQALYVLRAFYGE